MSIGVALYCLAPRARDEAVRVGSGLHLSEADRCPDVVIRSHGNRAVTEVYLVDLRDNAVAEVRRVLPPSSIQDDMKWGRRLAHKAGLARLRDDSDSKSKLGRLGSVADKVLGRSKLPQCNTAAVRLTSIGVGVRRASTSRHPVIDVEEPRRSRLNSANTRKIRCARSHLVEAQVREERIPFVLDHAETVAGPDQRDHKQGRRHLQGCILPVRARCIAHRRRILDHHATDGKIRNATCAALNASTGQIPGSFSGGGGPRVTRDRGPSIGATSQTDATL